MEVGVGMVGEVMRWGLGKVIQKRRKRGVKIWSGGDRGILVKYTILVAIESIYNL